MQTLDQSAPRATQQLLTPRQTSRIFGISRRSFWRLVSDGKIHVVRLGRRTVRVPVREVERLCQEGIR